MPEAKRAYEKPSRLVVLVHVPGTAAVTCARAGHRGSRCPEWTRWGRGGGSGVTRILSARAVRRSRSPSSRARAHGIARRDSHRRGATATVQPANTTTFALWPFTTTDCGAPVPFSPVALGAGRCVGLVPEQKPAGLLCARCLPSILTAHPHDPAAPEWLPSPPRPAPPRRWETGAECRDTGRNVGPGPREAGQEAMGAEPRRRTPDPAAHCTPPPRASGTSGPAAHWLGPRGAGPRDLRPRSLLAGAAGGGPPKGAPVGGLRSNEEAAARALRARTKPKPRGV